MVGSDQAPDRDKAALSHPGADPHLGRPAQLAEAPLNLPAAARNAVFQSMLRTGLLEEVSGDHGTVLRINEAGLAAVGALGAAESAVDATVGAQEGREARAAGIATQEAQERLSPPTAPQPGTSVRDAATAGTPAWSVPPCLHRSRRSGRPWGVA